MEALIKYLADYLEQELGHLEEEELLGLNATDISILLRDGIDAYESTHERVVTTIPEKG